MPAYFRPLILLSLGAFARAQVPPPSPPPHHDAVILDRFITSASPFLRSQVEVAQSTTVLSGHALLLKQQATLGETLAGEPGISSTSFGPGASRPVIRGLGGDRIRLLENSVGTIDASVTSPDHAVSVEPFLVERVEVVRGPAALLYGSSAVGGVVNVITHRIETEFPTQRTRASGEVRFGGPAEEQARGGLVDLALHLGRDQALVLHADAFRRSTEDLRIPGFAESALIRAREAEEAIEHGESPPAAAKDRLPNSSLDTEGSALGLSWVGKAFHLGASYSEFASNYGVPGHAHEHGEEGPGLAPGAAGVRIDLDQQRFDAQGEWRAEGGAISALRFKFGHGDYEHREIEPAGTVSSVFRNRGSDARAEILHGNGKEWSGALGAQATHNRLAVQGEEAFLPPSRARTAAVFVFEELIRSPVTWQFGGRAERTAARADGRASRRESELSGSLGLVWKLDATHSIAFTAAQTARAPNTQELFAFGPHIGTQAFEVGDDALAPEESLSLELGIRRRAGFVTGALSFFSNRFDGYIFEQPTNQVARPGDSGWEFVPGDLAGPVEDGLPVFRYVQRDAHFWGGELETLWHLHESTGYQLDLKLAADFTRARENGRSLPRIPPARGILGLAWASGPWAAGTETQFVFRPQRIAAGETSSEPYALVSAHVSWSHAGQKGHFDIFVRGTNLLDEEARLHTSFVKDLAPLPGRGVSAGMRFEF